MIEIKFDVRTSTSIFHLESFTGNKLIVRAFIARVVTSLDILSIKGRQTVIGCASMLLAWGRCCDRTSIWNRWAARFLVKYRHLLLQFLVLRLKEWFMVLFAEFWQLEFVVLRVTEIFLWEDLTLILRTLGLVHHCTHVPRLHLLSFVLLRDDVLVDTFVDLSIIVIDEHRVSIVLFLLLLWCPVMQSTHHMIAVRVNPQVFVIIASCTGTSSCM